MPTNDIDRHTDDLLRVPEIAAFTTGTDIPDPAAITELVHTLTARFTAAISAAMPAAAVPGPHPPRTGTPLCHLVEPRRHDDPRGFLRHAAFYECRDPDHQRFQLGHSRNQHRTKDLPEPTSPSVVAVLE
ncbi:hypothetical protein [Nocardia donostiensis]|uniref:Uncharacterized protein n=1 Tax=Nocardia donostiensis TaxID=1538463 RepID=A0A1W0AQD1_9NOCA|nr:hypothetical protein [Nocardia donostiensis]ONM46253.1 hypothetical protein B0T46_24040 [Nocardia donostiensis]OQS12455.1 hypothetical protein B0T36_25115 [Nocardia donostiensis]OQS18422.1 hypothetical protein B0T44_19650 [Nocardia donostiensis]